MKKQLILQILFFLFFFTQSDAKGIGDSLVPKRSDNFMADKHITSIKVDTTFGVLLWTSVNETDTSSYIIEEFRWNRYIKLATVKKKVGSKCEYQLKVPVDSGLYHLRIKYVRGDYFVGKDIDVPQSNREVHTMCGLGSPYMLFSRATRYEIYNTEGKMLKKGYADKVLRDDLEPGIYYLNYENVTTEFIVGKKR